MKQKRAILWMALDYNVEIKINYQISAPIQVHVTHEQER